MTTKIPDNLKVCAIASQSRAYTFDPQLMTDGAETSGWCMHEHADFNDKDCPNSLCSGGLVGNEICLVCGGDGTSEDETDWSPTMNIIYPLPDNFEVPEDWRERLDNMTIVQVDGQSYLALTGDGMDMSWEICATYINLGYYPPAELAELPAMAGRGEDEKDKVILACCMKSCVILQGWMTQKISRMCEGYANIPLGIM